MTYVLFPADKVANNVVVVWQLYYVDTLKRELIDTNANKLQASFEVPWVCLQFVIVVFPDHTHLLFFF